MAYTPWDTYVDTVPVPTTIEELQQALQLKYNTTWPEIANQISSLGGDPTSFDELADLCGLGSVKSADGTRTVWYYKDTLDDFTYTPTPSVSTNTYTTRSSVQTPMNTSIDDVTGKVTVSNAPKTGSFTQNATYVMAEVGQATTIASVGTWLGKKLSSLIYENAPNYFPDIDWSTFNPDTWAGITNGDDSFGSQLFNFIFGIDPTTGQSQAYMDADAASYLAYALYKEKWFDSSVSYPRQNIPYETGETFYGSSLLKTNIGTAYSLAGVTIPADQDPYSIKSKLNFPCVIGYGGWGVAITYCETGADLILSDGVVQASGNEIHSTSPAIIRSADNSPLYRLNMLRPGWDAYYAVNSGANYVDLISDGPHSVFITVFYVMPVTMISGVIGVDNQTGATLPDTSTWEDIPSTDSYLRTAYPDTYNDAIQYDVLQPDGNVITKTYIPVPFPENLTSPNTDTNNDPWNNPQPTTDGANQTNPLIDLLTGPADFIKELIKTITQPTTETNTDNPTDTGTGTTPTLTPISGASTALWSVYNPTKAQIDSFGAWLWTDNVIQQFIQLLNNPMEGIITLHKVFATPVVSGAGTIVVGRLDSGVGSNLVSQQYVTVDCGSVRLDEYFGNVFDYSPHTMISLYLPFIGFVPLNVDDVMRSTISISYGVDVFTGACLATVNVDRDGNSVGLYQYSGVASVEYPLTGAQHGGLVNGLLGVAGGVAGIALASTGVGVVAGASAIAGGLTNAAKTSNARSGGFSGNAGAMGVKIPYLIIERPITKVANTFDILNGYPTNYDCKLGDCSGNVIVKYVHVDGISATEQELSMIEAMLNSGVVV